MERIAEAHPLAARMAGFIGHLRLNDFVLGPDEARAALELAARLGPARPDLQRGLKVLLTGRREEWERFDDLFETYFLARGRERGETRTARKEHQADPLPAPWRGRVGGSEAASGKAPQIEAVEPGTEGTGAEGRLIASERTSRLGVDLRHFADPQEIAEAERLAYRLAAAIRHRLSRRWRAAKRGARIDLRRTMRASLARGGEPLDLYRRAIPDRPARIVVFLDVSGSMAHYSRFFLQFVRGLVAGWLDADAYLVHTRLVRVTDAIREKSPLKAMGRVSLMADGFGGGTRLGECLATFNDAYAKTALNSRSVAVILSDGYDTGPAARLAAELQRMRKRARRIVWLNPLLGWKDYRPVTEAMQAALPFIDHFAAANTLAQLAAIEDDLARL